VRVAAASDLQFAMNDLLREFQKAHDVDVQVSYGSSGTFYAQLLNHAPIDVFFSADLEYPRQLASRGLTLENGGFDYAVGRLAIWTRTSSTLDVEARGLDVLRAASIAHVAIANPEHAPYGRAAVAAMRSAGVYDAVERKLVLGENVSQALQFVQSGAADVGVIALSLALAPPVTGQGRFAEVPLTAYPRLAQGGTVLKWAEDVESALALRAFVIAPEGRAILKQYGFYLPDGG
jgi:molybdate transport system substrate-binding protein